MTIAAIIPARMASSRLPGKPLKSILGLSMIEHVRRRVNLCEAIDDVIVATCDQEIIDEVEKYGGKAVMTSNSHESCIDRVAEAASRLKANIIINVQGDMPLVDPNSLLALAQPLLQDENIHYTDMIASIVEESEINNANVVKVVSSLSMYAMYYSREPIPSPRKFPDQKIHYYKQLGINAFRRCSLKKFTNLSMSPLETIESIDMNRLLENELNIKLILTDAVTVGVDTVEDLIMVREIMDKDSTFYNYKDSIY
ncbi:MAG: 3-deoxy-manno-octulosonate cytidylyltransferase [Candidatus Marinimicrobia bacterium]|jgi:3-deoxy-manno-octulosonate cytidylyltransferase (CMP-KDO synthetase)|nr:3-deoxy-manno-octulosonate cytidylyltransferase [Candidatus Neomarinimicrobiota bacterium]